MGIDELMMNRCQGQSIIWLPELPQSLDHDVGFDGKRMFEG